MMLMRFFNFSSAFISKFNGSHVISLSKTIPLFRYKNPVLQAAFLSSSTRCFYVTHPSNTNTLSSNGGKLYRETENEYAHQVMEKLSSYSDSLIKWPFQYKSCVVEESLGHSNIVDRFAQITLHNISEGTTLEHVKYIDIVEKLCVALPDATDEDVKKILHYLCMWPQASSTKARNFKNLWNLLDQECVKRMKLWNVSQKLLIGDYWFHLKLSRITHYNSELIYNLIKDIDSLSNHHIVQLMFYINLQRKIPDQFVPSLEKKLESIINSLTLEEVGVVCLGFFKTQNRISSGTLIQCIIKRFMHNVEKLNTVTVAAVLKFFRKSLNFSFIDLYILTLHKCVSCLDNFDIPTSVHLALLSSECNVYHPLLLNSVSEKLAHKINNIRIKDCAKFLLCLSMYSHIEGKFHSLLIAELKKESRQRENFLYPQHFIHIVLYYSYMGLYDYDLLAKAFEEKFVENCWFSFPEMQANFVEIDYCVEIECPDYKGPKLDASKRKVLQNRRGNLPNKSQNQNMQTRLLNEIYNSIVEILGSDENVLIRHILPHTFSPDIIIRLSGNIEKSFANVCQAVPSECILIPPKDEVWAALVVCSTYSFAYKSTHMTAIPTMKLRQLQLIGYCATFIPFFNVSRNLSRRKEYLIEILNMLNEQHRGVVSK